MKMKKILLLTLCISLMAVLMPFHVRADSPSSDFQVTNGVIVKYTGSGGDVVIPSVIDGQQVTGIGDSVFNENKFQSNWITSVTIPDGVTSIGASAFIYCIYLTSVTIPDSVQSIGTDCFGYCRSLKKIRLSQNLIKIEPYTFEYCSALSSITIPDKVTVIDYESFYSCSGLTSVKIGANVTEIGNYTFQDCYGLVSVLIGERVAAIDNGAFEGCYALPSITIPASVTSIGSEAFTSCAALSRANFKGNAPALGSNGFSSNTPNFAIVHYPGATGFDGKDYTGYRILIAYKITMDATNGTIISDTDFPAENDRVTLTVTPNSGYVLKSGSLSYTDSTGKHAITDNSFLMPGENVTVTATFDSDTAVLPIVLLVFLILVIGFFFLWIILRDRR